MLTSGLTSGPAVKLSIYLSDGAKHLGVPVYTSLLDFLFKNGVYGTHRSSKASPASVPPIACTPAHILDISDHLPIKIEIIETREKVEVLLPEIEKRTGSGIIEIQETTVRVPARK